MVSEEVLRVAELSCERSRPYARRMEETKIKKVRDPIAFQDRS